MEPFLGLLMSLLIALTLVHGASWILNIASLLHIFMILLD